MNPLIWRLLGIAALTAGTAPPHQVAPTATEPYPASQRNAAPQTPIDPALACPLTVKHEPEKDGIYEVGHGVTMPQLTKSVEAAFTDEAKQQARTVPDFQAVTLLMLVIDTKGKPKEICVARGAGFGLDKQAVQAAAKYRFRPAMKEACL